MAGSKYDLPSERPLQVYAFDPSYGRNLGNFVTLDVRYEPLAPGPVGRHLAVIDYDVTNDCYYSPIDLEDRVVLLGGGLERDESDPRFHQQMVYAVASETIKRFEIALGRIGKWGFRGGSRGDPHRRRLKIFPHAMQEANAYYSRELGALLFGYFAASETDPGANLPGQTVFTCLSHDIIAHEMTHALIDGQRAYFLEPTAPDTLAFHEAFADIVALFQHFSYPEVLTQVIQKTGGLIHRMDVAPEIAPAGSGPIIQAELATSNPLVQLAKQFGESMGMRSALRQALGTPPNSRALESLFEPHDRGAILVAAIFDAFYSVYLRRTRDLMRIATGGGTMGTPGNLHPDLVNRLTREATKTAAHFANICIRALDYCPPIDILFGDYLRALITADYDLVPNDKYEYRAALIEAFRSRGIRPSGVMSYAETALRWSPPEETLRCDGLQFDFFKLATPQQQKVNARRLSRFGSENAAALGLTRNRRVQAHSFHALIRIGPEGRRTPEIVAELMQKMDVLQDPTDKSSEAFTFRGGSTIVFNEDGTVRYAIHKTLDADNRDNERLDRQRAYRQEVQASSSLAVYVDTHDRDSRLNLARLHSGF